MESSLSTWVMSILGIVIISLLIEIILPNGKTSKIIKGIMAVLSIFVIISPIKNLVGDINLELISKEFAIDKSFIANRDNEKLDVYKETIEKDLKSNGYLNISISFKTFLSKEETQIESVFVDLRGLVLSNEKLNIDKYTNITAIIKNIISVKEDSIIFYE